MNYRKKRPSISVLLPIYNSENYVKESITSIREQSFSDYEVIVVNDGSTDNSIPIVIENIDERFAIIHCKHDYISSLNHGILACNGKYLARMDADDIMHPDRLAIQFEYMEANPQIDICGSYMSTFGLYEHDILYPTEHERIATGFLLNNVIGNPTTIIRKQFIKQHNLLYSKLYPYAEDYKFWIDSLIKGGRFANIDKCLLKYRISNLQTTNRYRDECEISTSKISFEYIDYVLNTLFYKSKFSDIIININAHKLYKNLSPQNYINIISILLYEYLKSKL
jgi:glycosyltransferase involved in cell wall biosynthesis